MTKETRGLLLEFLNKLNEQREIGQLETIILDKIQNIISYADNCNTEKIKEEVLKLEDDFEKYGNLIKYQYFDYGVSASELEKERNLKWEPKGLLSTLAV